MTRLVTLQQLRAAERLGALDEHFARSLGQISGESRPEVLLAAALASQRVSEGHVCLELASLVATLPLPKDTEADEAPIWPELSRWLELLRSSPLVARDGETTPLVLDAAGRLYLRRYHRYEQQLGLAILERLKAPVPVHDLRLLARGLARCFPDTAKSAQLGLFAQFDRQREAARLAVELPFVVISGGPGTGKTHTVVKLLALLIEQALARGKPAPRMHLMAPTGKAAARLNHSIARARDGLDAPAEVLAAITTNAGTIHRALGARPGGEFRHGPGAPLPTELVVVDEASMVDLALMSRLFGAIPADARVILLGDQNQLASVEAGAVLGDLCGTGLPPSAERERAPMARAVVQLERSYRYTADSGIGKLAEAINAGDAAAALELLESERYPDVLRVEPDPRRPLAARLEQAVLEGYRDFLSAVQEDPPDPEAALAAFDGFRVLCAHRRGPLGVEAINTYLEAMLERRSSLEPRPGFYTGRPVMVTRNDAHLHLFNGDIGIVLRHGERYQVHFAGSNAAPRAIAAASLPAHETVFAMSVHKSQGSEFDEVAVVLPREASPISTRELLYTAVTRARRKVLVQGSRERIVEAVTTRVERSSGLSDLLWRP
jgi:exodeoxyribonuclease V alpha subunit